MTGPCNPRGVPARDHAATPLRPRLRRRLGIARSLGVRTVAGMIAASVAFAWGHVAGSDAQVTPPPGSLVPDDMDVGGHDLTEWEVAWVKWRLALPRAAAPSDQECITADQAGPVWFLDGNGAQPSPATRRCAVPAGSYLMFGPWFICSTVGPWRVRSADLARCSRHLWRRNFRGLRVTVDGIRLRPSGHPVVTAPFRFQLPSGPDMLLAGAARRGRAAVRAKATLLAPLVAGEHRLEVTERYRGLRRKVTYNISAA